MLHQDAFFDSLTYHVFASSLPPPVPTAQPTPGDGDWLASLHVGRLPSQTPEGSFARQNSMRWRNPTDGAIPRDLEVIVAEGRKSHLQRSAFTLSLLAPGDHGVQFNLLFSFS